jgi:uncharacterized phage protein (TIGR02220 family)
MDKRGYIRLSRKFFENKYWLKERTYSQAEAWLDLIQMARFEAEPLTKVLASKRQIVIERGEIHASLRFLSARWKWGIMQVRTFLKSCVASQQITQRITHGESIITLCKYDGYNPLFSENNTPDNIPVSHRYHTDNTKLKKENKVNKENNNKSPYGDMSGNSRPPSRSDEFLNYISFFNNIRGTRYRGDSKTERQFKARLKEGFTPARMIEALKNAMQDAWHLETGFKYLTPEFFTRPDKLDRFLNTSPASSVSTGDDFKNKMANFIHQKTNQKTNANN